MGLEIVRKWVGSHPTYVTEEEPESGGSQPEMEILNAGGATTIANGAQTFLPVGTSVGPDTLLNVTDPTDPIVLTDGTYAVTVVVCPSDTLTAAGSFLATLEISDQVFTNDFAVNSAAGIGRANEPVVTISAVQTIDAPADIFTTVRNLDGSASRDFAIAKFVIVKLA